MNKISFLISRLLKMDYRAMLETAKSLHKKSGKPTAWLMLDMARCAARYGAGYMDYKIAEMYRLDDKQRKTQRRGVARQTGAEPEYPRRKNAKQPQGPYDGIEEKTGAGPKTAADFGVKPKATFNQCVAFCFFYAGDKKF